MPTYYYIDDNEEILDIITNCETNNNFEELEKYIDNQEKAYGVFSLAVAYLKISTLQHFFDKLILFNSMDGNCYELIHLAICMYRDTYSYLKTGGILTYETALYYSDITEESLKQIVDIIIILVESQIKRELKPKTMLRDLISFCDKFEDYFLVDMLCGKYKLDMWDLYHYSIAWNCQKVFNVLLEKYSDLINFDWTKSAIEIAYRFNNHEMVKYVFEQLREKKRDVYDKYVYLLREDEYLYVKDKEIPENTIVLKFQNNFNIQLENIVFPKKLKKILFNPYFNQSLENVVFPESVEEISFGVGYNWSFYDKSLKNVKFPSNLKKFINEGPGNTKESLDEIKFPPNMEVIVLGYKCSKSNT
jgi:hypothetical protein